MSEPCCIFCGGGSSKEHIIPRWLLRDIDLYGIKFKMGFGVQPAKGDFEMVMQPQPLSSFYTTSVCVNCNNGWMSKLEARAQKILSPLIETEWPTNDKAILQGLFIHCADLTRWLLKTAATFGTKMSVRIPEFVRQNLYNGQIPEWVYADIAFCERNGHHLGISNSWNVVKEDKVTVRKNDESFRMTWHIRHLVLRISHFPFTERHQLKPRYPVRLYPQFGVPADHQVGGTNVRSYAYSNLEQLEHETTYVTREGPDILHPNNWPKFRRR